MTFNQSDYEKISLIVTPQLVEIWHQDLTETMHQALLTDLKRFSKETLVEAMANLRRSRSKPPLIHDIIKAAEEVEESHYVNTGATVESKSYGMPPEYLSACEQVMQSWFGQLALKEGWGISLQIEVKRSGRTNWSMDDAPRFRRGLQDALDAAISLDRNKDQKKSFPLAPALLQLWEAMCKSERELAQKYLRA